MVREPEGEEVGDKLIKPVEKPTTPAATLMLRTTLTVAELGIQDLIIR